MKIIHVHCGEETNVRDPRNYEHYWTGSWNKTWENSCPYGIWTHDLCDTLEDLLHYLHSLTLLCVLHIYRSAHIWFSYIHNRYSSLGWFIWTQLNDQLPVGLLAQLVKHCTGVAEIGVQIPYGPEFFSGSISTTSSVVFLAARVSYIRFFTVVLIYDFHIVTIIVGLTVWVQFSQIKEKSIFSATEGGK